MKAGISISLLLVALTAPASVRAQLPILCCAQQTLESYCGSFCASASCSATCVYRCGFLLLTSCGSMTCDKIRPDCGVAQTLKNQGIQTLLPADVGYEARRTTFNGICTARPALVVVPTTAAQVSAILVAAKQSNMEISVRSGGHSYNCYSLKTGAILIDMRSFNQIKLIDTPESVTGKAAWLGTGAIWGNVLRTIDPKVYSYPHGQCRSVAAGGFLLGGGVNWMGTYNKYGYGAEYVLQIKAVTANGSIVTVYPNRTVFQDGRTVMHTPGNDLFFGLRGAGSSLALATDFLYRINLEPETRPAVVMIWIETEQDLATLLQAARSTTKYSIMLNQPISSMDFWKRPLLDPLMKALPLTLQTLKLINRKQAFPVQVMITDITLGAGPTTAPLPAIQYLKSQGVKVMVDDALTSFTVTQALSGLFQVTGGLDMVVNQVGNVVYEEIEQEQESWVAGQWASASANFGSLADVTSFSNAFLNNPYVGVRRSRVLSMVDQGCSFCFWMVHFRNRQNQTALSVQYPISTRTDKNLGDTIDINLTCMFPPSDTRCVKVIQAVREEIATNLSGKQYSKYYNFPSCSAPGTDWRTLYWGANVPQLMSVKNYWDSGDMFRHCQSLTSNNATCCPT